MWSALGTAFLESRRCFHLGVNDLDIVVLNLFLFFLNLSALTAEEMAGSLIRWPAKVKILTLILELLLVVEHVVAVI